MQNLGCRWHRSPTTLWKCLSRKLYLLSVADLSLSTRVLHMYR